MVHLIGLSRDQKSAWHTIRIIELSALLLGGSDPGRCACINGSQTFTVLEPLYTLRIVRWPQRAFVQVGYTTNIYHTLNSNQGIFKNMYSPNHNKLITCSLNLFMKNDSVSQIEKHLWEAQWEFIFSLHLCTVSPNRRQLDPTSGRLSARCNITCPEAAGRFHCTLLGGQRRNGKIRS